MLNRMFSIYCDSLIEAEWFQNLSEKFKDSKIIKIKERSKNNNVIEDLIKYDRPDIILTKKGKALLVVEKMREVPTGHNVGQRMARIVRASELQIPCIYFFPYRARKHGKYTSICNVNARLFFAINKINEIHKSSTVAVNWPTDTNGELIGDEKKDLELREIMSNLIDCSFDKDNNIFNKLKEKNAKSYEEAVKTKPQYSKPPGSVKIVLTESILNQKITKKELNNEDVKKLKKYKECCVYTIEMKKESCKRQDPYTGTQFIYEYSYCRVGTKVENREKNLILNFPLLKKKYFLSQNTNNFNTKSSNWYLIANAFLFEDGIHILR